MPRQTAADFAPEVLKLFDQYVHGGISRRGFLDGASKYAVGGTAAAGLLEALAPNFAMAQQVSPTDARLVATTMAFDSPQGYGKASGYLVKPARPPANMPAILVVHENRGLNPHIEDIARRLALEGYLVFAPDALFTLGGYPGDEDKARDLFGKLDQAKTREDFVAAARYARGIAGTGGSNGKLGAIGFCYGGGMVNFLATRVPELLAGVPFYGAPAPADQASKIKAELLLMFADNDERINAAWPAYDEALKAAGVKHAAFKYPGTQHGFNNDTTPRFNAEAAALAWGRALELFNRTLR